MQQSVEILQAIDERHVRYLDRRQQMILAGAWLVMTAAQMADAFGCSESTISRKRQKLTQEVFDFTGLAGTPQLLRLWSERHWTCCTAGMQEMIENSHLLTSW